MELTNFLVWARRGALAGLILFVACESSSSQPVDYTATLQGLTDDTTVPATTELTTQADALVATLRTLETANDAPSLAAAQNAWRTVRRAFRLLDAAHYGPVLELGTTDRIDTFPVDANAIAAIVAQAMPTLEGAPNKAKGFLALESLLFSADGLANPKKRTVARLYGEDIAAASHALADAWTTGGYATQMKTAGTGSTRYATQRAAIDDLVGAVGYALELVVAVDLANPLGRQTAGKPDPTQVIAAPSDNSVNDMVATLDGVSAAYEGRGFTTLVRVQSAPLDDTFRSQLATCETKLKALAKPFASAVVNQTPVVQDAYDACKTAKNTWNVEVTSALAATVKPPENDGD